MFEFIALIFFLFVVALAFAWIEINTEGTQGAGWAEDLPTWKIDHPLVVMLWSGRPLTGYHSSILIFMLIMVHFPFFVGLEWTAAAERKVIGFYMLFWVLEDFLWFVINPAYGVKRFRKELIWWHAPRWWKGAPLDYWVFTPLGIILLVSGYF
ncbi:hypothetical protein [Cerasicoccus fimbriatus]|uniref:hypothetical protein n=1 Tax=Cerasicoccus fimbriatus TaxID=3014554 RepID=UPI0022B3E25D|nr:hypothetical protein [Cerasicoccus sp. TK19100]